MIDIVFWILLAFFVLPILTYLIVKFGTAGYLRAKQQHKPEQENNEKQE
jgi:cytochrome c oxidase subunit IV